MSFCRYDAKVLTILEGGLDILATALNFAEADVCALYILDFQLANLRLSLMTANRLDLEDTQVESHSGTLATTQIDIDLLLLGLFGSSSLDDVGM